MSGTSDELVRIARIRERLEQGARGVTAVRVGIGDDAAVLAPSAAQTVLTVDTSIEDVHFKRGWASWRDIGRRAFVCAASDIAAMGARPRAALVAIALPADIDDEALMEMVDGIGLASDELGAPVVGGNLSAAAQISLTTTITGELDGDPARRNGARRGDSVYVTGTIGAAALGIELLTRGLGGANESRHDRFVARWRRPLAHVVVGQRLRELVTAMIDVSDGLVQDLGHICAASGVGATIDATAVPLARELGLDPFVVALSGGDDYELLFTSPASDSTGNIGTRIGTITDQAGEIEISGPDGARIELPRRGYRHFA